MDDLVVERRGFHGNRVAADADADVTLCMYMYM